MIARTAMTASATMQRKAIRLAIIAVSARGLPLLRRRLICRLAAGDKRRQPVHVGVACRRRGVLLRARLEMLRLRLRLRLRLLARIERLRLTRRKRLAANVRLFVVPFVERIVGNIAAHIALLLLVIGLRLAKLFLSGGDQAEKMFGVLVIVLGGDGVAGTLRVARKLQVFFGDVGRRSANFHVGSIGLVHAR